MKIIWEWSLKSETNRILDTCRQIGNGFFALHNFYPLPYSSSSHYHPTGVYLPLLPYSQIHRYWERIGSAPLDNLAFESVTGLRDQLIPSVANLHLNPPNTTILIEVTDSALVVVNDFLHQLIPHLTLPQQVIIHPTYFGTSGSFNWLDQRGVIKIYLRMDRGLDTIVECYLTSILRPHALAQIDGKWHETEYLVDWLMSCTILKSLLPTDSTWRGTISSLDNHLTQSVRDESLNFLAKLGVPSHREYELTVKDGLTHYHHRPIPNLTSRENSLLVALVRSAPRPLTYDEIGNILFSSDAKFSLSAINQAVTRLRTKLSRMGIAHHHLATASGIGYYLKN